MERILIRHAPVGEDGTSISEQGRRDSERLGTELQSDNIDTRAAATSELPRARQTAEALGATAIKSYWQLNEVSLTEEQKFMLRRNEVPEVSEDDWKIVESLIDTPPRERIWVGHGGTFALYFAKLGIYVERFLPVNLEARVIDI